MSLPPSRILLVEDDPVLMEALELLMKSDNVVLTGARDGVTAVRICEADEFDLILLDLGLPGMNGFDVLRQFKSQPKTASVPVIVLTAWNSTSDKLRGSAKKNVEQAVPRLGRLIEKYGS